MVTHNLKLTDYRKQPFKGYTVSINSFWVTIYDSKDEVYKREASSPNWLDDSHEQITKAISALESALLKVIPQ